MVLVSVGVIGAEVLEVLISLAAMLGFLATIVVSTSRGGSRDGSSDDEMEDCKPAAVSSFTFSSTL